MKHVEADLTTSAPPDKVIAALTDFSERRPTVWPDLSEKFYEVREVHPASAVVKEGSTSPFTVWATEAYDWSEPGTVTWTVLESNFCTPGSFVSAHVRPEEEGSHVHLIWEREGKGIKGRFIVGLVAATKAKPIVSSMKKVLDGVAST